MADPKTTRPNLNQLKLDDTTMLCLVEATGAKNATLGKDTFTGIDPSRGQKAQGRIERGSENALPSVEGPVASIEIQKDGKISVTGYPDSGNPVDAAKIEKAVLPKAAACLKGPGV